MTLKTKPLKSFKFAFYFASLFIFNIFLEMVKNNMKENLSNSNNERIRTEQELFKRNVEVKMKKRDLYLYKKGGDPKSLGMETREQHLRVQYVLIQF